MLTLRQYQQDIIREDRPIAGLFLSTGCAKTAIALHLARGKTLVIAPKMQVLDGNWEREVKKWGLPTDLTVISKERLRKEYATLPRYDTVILDEAHTLAGATPNIRYRKRVACPKTSQLFEAALAYIDRTSPTRLYALTATPTRSPMCVWALARLLRHTPDFYKWRDAFYVKLPMPGREVFTPKKESATKERLGNYVKKLGYTGRLSDYFDVPEETDKTIACPLSAEEQRAIDAAYLEYPDPLVLTGKIHQGEQCAAKLERIEDLALEFGKVVVFARYLEQITRTQNYLRKHGYATLVLTGATQNRKEILQEAERLPRCVLIAQASLSSGWEAKTFPCMIFASCSYSIVDYIQGRGRIQRMDALGKRLYVHLIAGQVDKSVLKCLRDKQDFNEAIFAKTLVRSSGSCPAGARELGAPIHH